MAEDEREPTEMEVFCEDETVCPICQAEFIDIDDLQTHILQVHRSKPTEPQVPSDYQRHRCRFCNTNYASAHKFALHLRDEHIVNMKTCAFCTRAFTARQQLWKHEAQHSLTNSAMFSCSECTMMFTELSDLEYHELNSHNEGPGMMLQLYYPELSSVLFSQADCFMQQVGKKTVYKCICSYSTDDIMEYVKHVQTKKRNSYVCNTCNKVFLTKKQITRHIKAIACQHPKNTSLIKCPNCYKIVMRKDVKNHSKRCKAVECVKCQLTFDSLLELTTHKEEKHSMQSIILKECRYCSKSVVGLEMFKEHVVKHHSVNYLNFKYNCVYCEKIFDHPQRLFTHFNSMHRNIRPFVCNICDKTFLIRSKFTYHIKLAHESKGFVEFTKDLNVHFNAVKSPTAVTLTPPASLFTSAEEDELNKHGIEFTVPKQSKTARNTKNSKEPKLNEKSVKDNTNKDDSLTITIETEDTKESEETVELDTEEIEEPVDAEKLKTDDDFQSSDDEPIKKIKKKKGKYYKKLICNICEQKCYTKENYNRHMESHSNSKDSLKQCLKCSKKFKTIEDLKRHIQKQHTTSLINTLRTMVEKRKNKFQPDIPILRKEGFICNIEKVYVEPDYRPAAKITSYTEGDSRPKIDNNKVDRALLKILTEQRAATKVRPLIVMKKCVLDETIEPPTKGIKIQKCETLYDSIIDYVPAKLDLYEGPVEKSKFNFTYAQNYQDDGYYEDDIITNNDYAYNEETQSVHAVVDPERATQVPKPIKSELFMIQSSENNELSATNSLLIPNEQTKKLGKINIATVYYTETGQATYKIIPFKINNGAEEDTEAIEEAETLLGAPKLVQSNPFAHLMDTDKLISTKQTTVKKYYKPKLDNPQLRIAKALMELKIPNTKKKQIRYRPPKGQHVKKSLRPENEDVFKYEILDDDAENWAMITED